MTPHEDWKEKAELTPLLSVAQMFGAKLKRSGAEWTGPCPFCGGKDRFSINVSKGKWFCRSHGGGRSPITLAAHIGNLPWKAAAEQLAGPCPSGPARPMSEAEQAERNRRRLESDAAQRAREARQMQQEENTRKRAQSIWDASRSIQGTIADLYLVKRGFIGVVDPVFRFHPALQYPGSDNLYPALICRVDDLAGDLTSIWRIYLSDDGCKASVPNAKLGLGPAAGGAVRIGGMQGKIAIAEGVESALGYWCLTGRKQPCWAALSTSGMIGFEAPLGIRHIVIAPDGDAPIKKEGDEFIPAVPAGQRAAEALRGRLLGENLACAIVAYPPVGKDFNDLWLQLQREVA